MGRLFGTDGIRGVVNQFPMTVDMAVTVGRAVADLFAGQDKSEPSTIVIGKDTRESGDMLESAVCAGVCSRGTDIYLAGVMPTPGVAFLTVLKQACAGIVISASHNPYLDNGIKIFDGFGHKLSVSSENELEAGVFSDMAAQPAPGTRQRPPGRISRLTDGHEHYADFLKNIRSRFFSGMGRNSPAMTENLKLVLDCANGATAVIVKEVFPHATVLFSSPDGKNINDRCGSEYPETLCRQVVKEKASAGFAFDGDGDRIIAVDEMGGVLSGDRIIAICAGYLKENGLLRNNTVVSTVMSNVGLSRALQEMGIAYVATDVGDRYVLEKMITCGASIGGEDSGHIIFADYQTTGDGLLTALILCSIMAQTREPLSALANCMTVYPQEIINVTVREKPDLLTLDTVQKEIAVVKTALGNSGRVLVRYSGTQPLCRVMVEAVSASQARQAASQLADKIRLQIGI